LTAQELGTPTLPLLSQTIANLTPQFAWYPSLQPINPHRYNTIAQLNSLFGFLNDKGVREKELKKVLTEHYGVIHEAMKQEEWELYGFRF
jgi:hypothetical protein